MCGREDKNVLLCTVLKAQATVLLYDQLTEEQEDLLLAADLGIISALCGTRARGRGAGQSGREDEQAGWGVQHERVVNTTLRVGSHWARGKGGLG
ncbi:hypothetical protein BDL97_07G123300 [Sphagnum fallax]|nr:hypothetical protein BDL97_07G123300 [Sphagnum fallax]